MARGSTTVRQRPLGAAGSGTSESRVRVTASVTESDIARRAYEFYLARGCADGHDVDDWLSAERELKNGSGSRVE